MLFRLFRVFRFQRPEVITRSVSPSSAVSATRVKKVGFQTQRSRTWHKTPLFKGTQEIRYIFFLWQSDHRAATLTSLTSKTLT